MKIFKINKNTLFGKSGYSLIMTQKNSEDENLALRFDDYDSYSRFIEQAHEVSEVYDSETITQGHKNVFDIRQKHKELKQQKILNKKKEWEQKVIEKKNKRATKHSRSFVGELFVNIGESLTTLLLSLICLFTIFVLMPMYYIATRIESTEDLTLFDIALGLLAQIMWFTLIYIIGSCLI